MGANNFRKDKNYLTREQYYALLQCILVKYHKLILREKIGGNDKLKNNYSNDQIEQIYNDNLSLEDFKSQKIFPLIPTDSYNYFFGYEKKSGMKGVAEIVYEHIIPLNIPNELLKKINTDSGNLGWSLYNHWNKYRKNDGHDGEGLKYLPIYLAFIGFSSKEEFLLFIDDNNLPRLDNKDNYPVFNKEENGIPSTESFSCEFRSFYFQDEQHVVKEFSTKLILEESLNTIKVEINLVDDDVPITYLGEYIDGIGNVVRLSTRSVNKKGELDKKGFLEIILYKAKDKEWYLKKEKMFFGTYASDNLHGLPTCGLAAFYRAENEEISKAENHPENLLVSNKFSREEVIKALLHGNRIVFEHPQINTPRDAYSDKTLRALLSLRRSTHQLLNENYFGLYVGYSFNSKSREIIVSYLLIQKNGRVSLRTPRSTEYEGEISISSGDIFTGMLVEEISQAEFYLVFEKRSANNKFLHGAYMGVSKYSAPAGGRILFIRINDDYDSHQFNISKLKPHPISIDVNDYQILINDHPEIYNYLTDDLPPYFDGVIMLRQHNIKPQKKAK